MLFFDPVYLLFMIPGIILSGLAQLYVRNAYSRWSQEANGSQLNGPEVARRIMRHAGLNVALETTPQELGDHYDPRSHTVRMSPGVAATNSVAAMAIVAHELGHAHHPTKSPARERRDHHAPRIGRPHDDHAPCLPVDPAHVIDVAGALVVGAEDLLEVAQAVPALGGFRSAGISS